MQVQNVSGEDRYLPAVDAEVAADAVIEVPEELGQSLLEQPSNWAAPKSKSAKVEE